MKSTHNSSNAIQGNRLSRNEFAELYKKCFAALVERLNHKYCLADREDAVAEAFKKVMYSEKWKPNKQPDSEKAWIATIYWQAKSYLSHYFQFSQKFVSDKELAEMGAEAHSFVDDLDCVGAAAYMALRSICREAGFEENKIDAVISCWLEKKNAKVAAAYAGIKSNHLYQLIHRAKQLVKSKGKSRFSDFQKIISAA